jgi:hypothetical protein
MDIASQFPEPRHRRTQARIILFLQIPLCVYLCGDEGIIRVENGRCLLVHLAVHKEQWQTGLMSFDGWDR